MNTTDLLNTLNTRRAAANMKPLKSWKDSKAKLQAAIDKLQPAPKSHKAPTFSAAATLKALNVNPKVGRALLRKHNVDRNDAAIRAFFAKR